MKRDRKEYMRKFMRNKYKTDAEYRKRSIEQAKASVKKKWEAMTIEERKAYARARYLSPSGQRAASRMMLKQQFGISEVPEVLIELHVLRRAIKKEIYK